MLYKQTFPRFTTLSKPSNEGRVLYNSSSDFIVGGFSANSPVISVSRAKSIIFDRHRMLFVNSFGVASPSGLIISTVGMPPLGDHDFITEFPAQIKVSWPERPATKPCVIVIDDDGSEEEEDDSMRKARDCEEYYRKLKRTAAVLVSPGKRKEPEPPTLPEPEDEETKEKHSKELGVLAYLCALKELKPSKKKRRQRLHLPAVPDFETEVPQLYRTKYSALFSPPETDRAVLRIQRDLASLMVREALTEAEVTIQVEAVLKAAIQAVAAPRWLREVREEAQRNIGMEGKKIRPDMMLSCRDTGRTLVAIEIKQKKTDNPAAQQQHDAQLDALLLRNPGLRRVFGILTTFYKWEFTCRWRMGGMQNYTTSVTVEGPGGAKMWGTVVRNIWAELILAYEES